MMYDIYGENDHCPSGKGFFIRFIVIAIGLIGFVFYLVFDAKRPIPAFNEGQMVQMRMSDSKGMVVGYWCRRDDEVCTYSVRFPSLRIKTNVSLFGSDGSIDMAPVSLVGGIREYELRGIQ